MKPINVKLLVSNTFSIESLILVSKNGVTMELTIKSDCRSMYIVD